MKKCDCYHITVKKYYTYHRLTGKPISHETKVGECWGTRECDECNCGGDRSKCDFYEYVRKEAFEAKFGEWISVEDRLPNDKQKVLTIDNEGTMEVCFYEIEWEGVFQQYGGNVKIYNVTHWMPLPKAPKENE